MATFSIESAYDEVDDIVASDVVLNSGYFFFVEKKYGAEDKTVFIIGADRVISIRRVES